MYNWVKQWIKAYKFVDLWGSNMARMIPAEGPVQNDSRRAEPDIYWRLAKRLPDSFTVIHSLPWLSAAASEIDGRPVPTGEIDFLVLEAELGILALEVKGGRLKYDHTRFIQVRTNEVIDPLTQIRRGTRGLAKWVKGAGGPAYRIGYGLVFPDSDMEGRQIPPALVDYSGGKPENICIDRNHLNTLAERVIEIMQFWRARLRNRRLTQDELDTLISLICPSEDYSPFWTSRIEYDRRTWLYLTSEQSACVTRLQNIKRYVITGRSGTGKTVIAVNHAKLLAEHNKTVLFLVYNVKLADELKLEFENNFLVSVANFHQLCRIAASNMNYTIPRSDEKKEIWYREGSLVALRDAVNTDKLPSYDALIIDEAQVLRADWLKCLADWFEDKPILACCDETQVFEYENLTTAQDVAQILQAENPYTLTVNLRSPRAVFNRLEETQPAPYQQFSPRIYEPDTLLEVAVLNPLDELIKTLRQLEKEGVPKDAIAVIYTKERPRYDDEIWKLAGQVESIFRYRGLESSVVIVWVVGDPHTTSLSCAYTRATSRCIVIYDVFSLLHQGCEFTQILLKSPSVPSQLSEMVDSIWPPKKVLPITEINLNSVKISWSHQWKGWVIEEDENIDTISSSLWRDHLTLSSEYPTFSLSNEDLLMTVTLPVEHLSTDPVSSLEHLWWCSSCERWTRHNFNFHNSNWCCIECELKRYSFPIPDRERKQMIHFDSVLSNPQNYPASVKQNMTLSLFALGYWFTLPQEQRIQIDKELKPNHFAKNALQVLLAIDILKLSPGDIITLESLRKKYQRWYPNLLSQVKFEDWKQWISVRVNSFLIRDPLEEPDYSRQLEWSDWLRKEKVGVYVRLPIPVLEG
jgi:hypothetical protein